MSRRKKIFLSVLSALILLLLVPLGYIVYQILETQSVVQTQEFVEDDGDDKWDYFISDEIPEFTEETVLTGLDKPWDMGMFTDGTFILTEKPGRINYYDGEEVTVLETPSDAYIRGEGGMLSLAVDPQFDQTNYIFVCFNSELDNEPDVRVVRYSFDKENKQLSDREDIITGMPSNASGRHSGCQLEFGPDNNLWVGTGDAADSSNPQDPKNLGGKILRVDRDGQAVEGNLESPFDPRIYSYGHRNTQGLAFFDTEAGFDSLGVSVEHGSIIDDEVNNLIPGNFGWDPNPNYNEFGVPMTDRGKFPDAIPALWSSGRSTEATSGATIAYGSQWKAWDQALFIGVQKNKKVIVLEFNRDLTLKRETVLFEGKYGRIRTVIRGTDGHLYFLSDNGGGEDVIVRLVAE
ncbi:MAG: PQQ-dependent sugar dehydrogenase [Candidatus Dojkabacteria bacterium]|nr:MAG: PQQ-dependent sugar dehydrogenase [Candidatus Dojkabacteria bacterium]